MKPTWLPSSRKVASAPHKSRGFTLAEILIALTITTFVLAGATSMFITFARTNMTMAARSEYDRQMRTAIQKLADDTREAATTTITKGTEVTLTMPQGETPQVIYYTYDASIDRLLRSEDGGADAVLLRDCTNFSASSTGDSVEYSILFSKEVGGRVIDLDRELTISMRN